MSNLSLDRKYISLVSGQLDKFTQKTPTTAICRCPICGDSKRFKNKTRFYFYTREQNMMVFCHNCSYSTFFSNFLKRISPTLYKEYVMEKFKKPDKPNLQVVEPPKTDLAKKFRTIELLQDLTCVELLPDNHICARFLRDRGIPKEYWNDLYYIRDFKSWVSKMDPENSQNIENTKNDERLVIPFFSEDRSEIIYFQGRALDPKNPIRYLSVKTIRPTKGIVWFGLDRIDPTKPVLICEGPLDSLFIPNCLASGSAALIKTLPFNLNATNCTIIFDNECRNAEICKLIKKTIKRGFSVFLWPENTPGKDINDVFLSGMSQEKILQTIHTNTFSGAEALLRFNTWKRC